MKRFKLARRDSVSTAWEISDTHNGETTVSRPEKIWTGLVSNAGVVAPVYKLYKGVSKQ